MKRTILICLLLVCAASLGVSQSGGIFSITTATLAGGSRRMAGGTFSMDVTSGQGVSGAPASGGVFTVTPGLPPNSQSATAAFVIVSGRVLTIGGRGVRSARVIMMDQAGVTRQVFTGPNGVFKFEGVQVGKSYLLSVLSRRFNFTPTTVIVDDQLTDISIVAN